MSALCNNIKERQTLAAAAVEVARASSKLLTCACWRPREIVAHRSRSPAVAAALKVAPRFAVVVAGEIDFQPLEHLPDAGAGTKVSYGQHELGRASCEL